MTFREWLRAHYVGRQDKYGDVAAETAPDTSWPDHITDRDELAEWLDEDGASDTYRDLVTELFDLYLADHGDPGTSGTTYPQEVTG